MESLGLLARGVAHDFNNLLSMIQGNTDLALRDVNGDSALRRRLLEISKVVQRAADLCGQMLAYSGRGSLTVIPFDLSVLVKEMTRMLEVAIRKRTVLKLNLQADLPRIQGDPVQLQQVVMNLILNSNEALGDTGGTITVATGCEETVTESPDAFRWFGNIPPGRKVFLEVGDTGGGIDTTTLENIFDPFYSTKFPGRGLGLATVLAIINRHHSAIGVASCSGKGSTFRVLLPAPPGVPREVVSRK